MTVRRIAPQYTQWVHLLSMQNPTIPSSWIGTVGLITFSPLVQESLLADLR